MSISGHRSHNDDLRAHRRAPITYGRSLGSGDFVEGVFENWESEFLEMGSYVILTAWLFHKGSPESKRLDADPLRAPILAGRETRLGAGIYLRQRGSPESKPVAAPPGRTGED